MSVYPTGLDTFNTLVYGVSEIASGDITSLQTAVTAVQTTIGVSGSYNFIPSIIEMSGQAINTGISTNGQLVALAINGNTAYVGGNFTSINGVARSGIAAINLSDNTLLSSFDANLLPMGQDPYVGSILVDSPNLIIGGTFEISGSSVVVTGLASIDMTTGALNESFNAAVELSPYGNIGFTKMIKDGSSIFVEGYYDNELQRIDKLDKNTGQLDATFPRQTAYYLKTYTIDDGKLFVIQTNNVGGSKFISTSDASVIETLGADLGTYYPISGVAYFTNANVSIPGGASRYSIAKVSDKNNITSSFVYEFYFRVLGSTATPGFFKTYNSYIIFDDNINRRICICRASDCKIVATIDTPSGFYALTPALSVVGDTLYMCAVAGQLGDTPVYGFSKIDLSVLP